MLTRIELMRALINGRALMDLLDYEPGLSCNGGRYRFAYRLDREYKLWVRCSYEGSEWELISESLIETWRLLNGVNWYEKATWIEEARWQVW